jgi:hypothetical protein
LCSLDGVCAAPISNAILWTHFVTPRGDQTQYDQTNWISYYKKEKSEQSECKFWPSRTLDFTCKGWNILSMPLCFDPEGLAGLSCAESMMRFCKLNRICWFGMDSEPDCFPALFYKSELVGTQSSTYFVLAKSEEMWTTCRWLSLLQLVHLGIHRDLVNKKLFCWSQVVLLEGHNFCL